MLNLSAHPTESLNRSGPPLISVIVPTKNAAPFLLPTLESLLAQPSRGWECIFIDGLSSDNTAEMIHEYCARTPIPTQYIQEADRGVADAFNKGIARASGHFLYFLCAGDRLRPDVLGLVSEDLAARPDILHGKVYEQSFDKITGGVALTAKALALFNTCHQGMFVSADLFRRIGGFNPRYPSFSDYEFNLRCFGTPGVSIALTDKIIADYLGDGPSERGDAVFECDREQLVSRYLGQEALEELQAHRERQDKILETLDQYPQRPWFIYGAGAYGLSLRYRIQNRPCFASLHAFVDSDPKKWGKSFKGYPVVPPDSSSLPPGTPVVIAVGNLETQHIIEAQLLRNGHDQSQIFRW